MPPPAPPLDLAALEARLRARAAAEPPVRKPPLIVLVAALRRPLGRLVEEGHDPARVCAWLAQETGVRIAPGTLLAYLSRLARAERRLVAEGRPAEPAALAAACRALARAAAPPPLPAPPPQPPPPPRVAPPAPAAPSGGPPRPRLVADHARPL